MKSAPLGACFLVAVLFAAPVSADSELSLLPIEPGFFTADAPSQLNERGFAYCLAQEAPDAKLPEAREDYSLGSTDLFLLYLSVYPGKRLPGLATLFQEPAHRRWARSFEPQERLLAESLRARLSRLSATGALDPGSFFRDALEACAGSPFCAALISHNVLRTLGRHPQAIYREPDTGIEHDLNPDWFLQEKEVWLLQIPLIQDLLMPLRPDLRGDGFGEWYHFFGIFAFSLHEMAVQRHMAGVDFVVRLNELLNPLLAGGPEGAEKARLDQDSVQVSWLFIHSSLLKPPGISCQDRASYVRSY